MNPTERPAPFTLSASEYILDNFEPTDRIVILVLNRLTEAETNAVEDGVNTCGLVQIESTQERRE
jgi:hypothetical protein